MKKSLLVLTVLFLSVSHLLAQVPSYVPTDGLVGWWPFNGNANDESGNGNDGVVNGATLTEDRFGNVSSAFAFDGIDDFLFANVNGQSAITVSLWYNSLYPTSWYPRLIGIDSLEFLTIAGNNPVYVAENRVGEVNGYPDFLSSSPYNTSFNEWHQVSIIHDYTTGVRKLYIDNVLLATGVTTAFLNIPIGDVVIGNTLSGTTSDGGAGYLGSIDDIAIYNRALTEQEIQALYTGQCPSIATNCTSLPSSLQQGLVGYWPFCGNANDESGNGNDGVVNGATLTEDRFGNAGSAYSFDGVDDFISVSNSESIDVQSEITITAWVKTTSIESSRPTIVCKERFENGIKYMLSIQPETGNVGIAVNNGPSTNCSACNQEIWSNESLISESWQHVSASWDNEILKVYVNGVLSQTGEGNLQGGLLPTAPSTPLLFGKAFTSVIPIYSTQFQGSLDDIGIWNRALTPEEVQELYTLDACTFTIYDTLTVENVINVYDTLTIENIVDVFDTTYINVEVYDTLTVENIVNVYDTLTIENVVTVYDTVFTNVENIINVYDTTYTNIENVIDVYDTTTVVETVFEYDTLTIENIVEVYDTLTVENVIDVYDTTTVVETVLIYDTTYVTVTDTLIIDIPSGVEGTILNTLLLYPNPTSDQLTINYGNFAAMAGYSLTIFDNGGSTVHETNITQAQETLDISQWSAGVYQVVVYNTGGVPVETRQIVIQ